MTDRTRPTTRLLTVLGFAAALVVPALALAPALADDADRPNQAQELASTTHLELSAPVTPYVFDGDVRLLPSPRPWRPGDPVKEIPRRSYVRPGEKPPVGGLDQGIDPLLSEQDRALLATDPTFIAPDRNFPGHGYTGVNPPDTVGDVGPNHYIQMVNSGGGAIVEIYDKTAPTPTMLASFELDTLGSGSCASGLGDPIVLYDRFADRWLLTEFSSSGNNLCMYVSQTDDPVSGGWFVYAFTAPTFPDYPKYAVWPTDANGGMGSYIVTTNETGSGVYAMERANMLVGDPSTFQRFVIADLSGFPFNAVTPADLDGPNPPPSGADAIIMRQRDTEVHGGPAAPGDVLEQWFYHVDWVNTANTTLTQQTDIDVSEFDSDLCGLSAFACFQQPGTSTTLDPLREVIMNRLQYQNFGEYETLVGNFVTDVDGTDHGGVRWFELRRTGVSAWTLHQEGTWAPDGDSRWMAASAMDQSGNIAVAYNVSSSSTFPSLRYTGREIDDSLGTMSQPESDVHAGTASNGSNRYGDYSAMNLDPSDDCTFWFTGMDNTSSSWRTQIASFRFAACGCDLFPLPLSLSGGPNGDNRVDLSWNDSELATVVEYRVRRSRTPGGPYTTIAVIPDSSMGGGNGTGYDYSDTTVSGGITYYYIVQASDGGACTSAASNEVSADATGICLLEPIFAGLQSVSTPYSPVCTLTLAWNAAAPECGGPVHYVVYRDTDPMFVPGPLNMIADNVGGTSYVDADVLANGLTYYYLVRAVDEFNGVAETNTVKQSAEPYGELQPPLFTDDAGDSGPALLTPGAPWSVGASGGHDGPGVYMTGDYGDNTCAALTSPSIDLGIGNTLEFWSHYEIETGWDKGEVQISTDGGANWSRLEMVYPTNSTRTSDACGLPTGDYFTGTNNDWVLYTADLSPYDGMTVMLRWEISTDSSQTRTGWFIDDIAIVNAPASCATASACEDNPIVDVQPNGPTSVCSLSIPQLSANLSGGVGPFTYQWFEDGASIPGADGPTFQPVDGGSHSYNVQVKADTCPDFVADGQSTTLIVESAPRFNGIVSAIDQRSSTCGIDLAWNPATSVCPGPLSYVVYRAQGPGVTATPGDYLTTLPGGATGYSDSVGLLEFTDYSYLVQAVDASTAQADGNAVVAVSAASGPDVVSFFDDGGDTVTSQLTPAGNWILDVAGGHDAPGVYAIGTYVDNDCSQLVSDPISIGAGDTLSVWSHLNTENSYDKGVVDISTDNGVNWARVPMDYPGNSTSTTDACGIGTGSAFTGDHSTWTEYTADLSAWAGQSALLRFEFGTDGSVQRDGWWIDEVTVSSPGSCATAAAGPPPVPDGRNATTPLRASRLTDAGDTVEVTWDTTSCLAADYNLIYGDLAAVASYAIDGAVCGLGASGSTVWNGVPAGDLYFLIVGGDGAGTESSWGTDGNGLERSPGVASGTCGVSVKDTTGTCP